MANYMISNKVFFDRNTNIGIAPGKFDTKQLILSALAVLQLGKSGNKVWLIRTVEREELAKCNLFINDDFTTMFPVIPSYHDISETWDICAKDILHMYAVYNNDHFEFVKDSIEEKLCNLEFIDCVMELCGKSDKFSDSFEDALNITLKIIDRFIKDTINEIMYYLTVKTYVEKSKTNYINLPFYVKGWRNIVSRLQRTKTIQYAIFPDSKETYLIEAFDKDLVMKKYVKGMPGICYSGRFFVKVTDVESATKIIKALPNRANNHKQKFA